MYMNVQERTYLFSRSARRVKKYFLSARASELALCVRISKGGMRKINEFSYVIVHVLYTVRK
jgi:hypothetical protein